MPVSFRYLLLGLLLPFAASANNLVVGQRVMPVGIADRGELLWQQNEVRYGNWNSAQLAGKVRVILHLAGRLSAKDENAAVIHAIQAARLPAADYQTTTIVNTDDAIPGSAIFVRHSLESSKATSPGSQFIVDAQGAAKRAWQLRSGGSAIVVLDKTGVVRFVREGALSADDVTQVVTLLKTLLSPPAADRASTTAALAQQRAQ